MSWSDSYGWWCWCGQKDRPCRHIREASLVARIPCSSIKTNDSEIIDNGEDARFLAEFLKELETAEIVEDD